MSSIDLGYWEIGFSALVVVALAVLLRLNRLGVSQTLLIASTRLVVQLLIIGYVLKFLFDEGRLLYVVLLASVMLGVAGHEIVSRQKRRLRGWRAYGLGLSSVFVASFAIALYGLFIVVRPDPWFMPQYSIPLLGMIMSNTMSAISLSMDRLTSALHDQRAVIEQKLALGFTAKEAVGPYAQDCFRTGIMPVINSMATAGIVSLPGMMTGQILGGASPLVAVKYQIMIWFMIAGGCGFGMALSLKLIQRQLFDERDRLRLERLKGPKA